MDNSKVDYQHKHPRYLMYQNRLKTFQKWPKQMRQNKYSLASSGLFYTNENDSCECFSCGVNLSQWGPTDIPLAEHKKWSHNCFFLKMIGYDEQRADDNSESFGLPSYLEQLCQSDNTSSWSWIQST